MNTVKWLAANEALQRLDPERKLPNRKRSLVRQTSRPQPLEVPGQCVLRPVDDPQIISSAHLYRGLGKPLGTLNGEALRLHDHALAAATRQLRPPRDSFRLVVRNGPIDRLERRRQQQRVARADARKNPHVPLVVLVNTHGPL